MYAVGESRRKSHAQKQADGLALLACLLGDDAAAMTRNTQQHSKERQCPRSHYTHNTQTHRPKTQAPSSSHLLPGPAAPASPAPFQAPASALHLSKEHGPYSAASYFYNDPVLGHPHAAPTRARDAGLHSGTFVRVPAHIYHSPFLPFRPLFQLTFHPPPAFKHDGRAWPWGWSSSFSFPRTLTSLSTIPSPMEAVLSERVRWWGAVHWIRRQTTILKGRQSTRLQASLSQAEHYKRCCGIDAWGLGRCARDRSRRRMLGSLARPTAPHSRLSSPSH